MDAYIPDLKFCSRDPRFATQLRYQPKKGKKVNLADFKYDPKKDHYICPNGKVLKLNVKSIFRIAIFIAGTWPMLKIVQDVH